MAADGLRVYIWPYGGLGHFGHAAVRLNHNTLPGGKCYISWWPGGGGDGNAYDQKKDRGVNKVAGAVGAPQLYQTRAQSGREQGEPEVPTIQQRNGDPHAIMQTLAERLAREGGARPMRFPMRALVFEATK